MPLPKLLVFSEVLLPLHRLSPWFQVPTRRHAWLERTAWDTLVHAKLCQF
jgi:hypothetical protein